MGILYLVSTPMGNLDEYTKRAEDIFKSVDVLVCEEWKSGKAIMRRFELECEILRLNEHNKDDGSIDVIAELKSGKSVALTSDCGAPVFSDPGAVVVKSCHKLGIPVKHVSGASSLISALVICGFSIDKFTYLGWLHRKKEEREKQLRGIQNSTSPTVIMETPYRLLQLLEAVQTVLGKDRMISVCANLTMESEWVKRGKVSKILDELTKKPVKVPFVLIVGGIKDKS